MSNVMGTSVLLTETDFDDTDRRPARATTPVVATPRRLDPGDDAARARLADMLGRPAAYCADCGRPLGDLGTRRSKSGKAYCHPCADRAVAAYYAAHPEARARRVAAEPSRERTGTSYLRERERFVVKYHAGNGRYQISDTQGRRWTDRHSASEAGATAIAIVMNAQWREQLSRERKPLRDTFIAPEGPRFPAHPRDRAYTPEVGAGEPGRAWDC